MSKIVCDICGTTYDDSTGACPVCGWNPGTTLEATSADVDDIMNDDFSLDDIDSSSTPPQKGKAVFDYDAVNTHRRRPPRPAPAPAPVQEEEEEEESGSNKFLVFILVVLILALLAVSGYIAYTKLWKPKNIGDDSNRPQETIVTEPQDGSNSGFGDETIATEEPAVVTEPTIPCTDLSLVASMDTLTSVGQYWRLMVKASPEDTTDKVEFTSGDENVVTVDEYGRVTAIGEGETVIVITCGDKRIETPAVVSFATPETEAPTEAADTPASGTSGTGTGTGTVATPSSGAVLKLKRTDITISRRGVYVTLELENGITAESVKWSTSDSSIATVYNGNVTAIGKGTCVVRAEYNGQVAECVVRCKF